MVEVSWTALRTREVLNWREGGSLSVLLQSDIEGNLQGLTHLGVPFLVWSLVILFMAIDMARA